MSAPTDTRQVAPGEHRRPFFVWMICAVHALGAVGTLLTLSELVTEVLPRAPASNRVTTGAVWFEVLRLGVPAVLSVAAAILLFRLRRTALYLEAALFVIMIPNTFYGVRFLGSLGQHDPWVIPRIILGTWILWYVWSLDRRGMLR